MPVETCAHEVEEYCTNRHVGFLIVGVRYDYKSAVTDSYSTPKSVPISDESNLVLFVSYPVCVYQMQTVV